MIASRDAILLALVSGNEARPSERQGHSHESLVLEAQEIADAACKAWGHADEDGLPCSRCGRVPVAAPPEPRRAAAKSEGGRADAAPTACRPHPLAVLVGRERCKDCGYSGTEAEDDLADIPESELKGVRF